MPSGNNSDEPQTVLLPNRRNVLKTLGVGGAAALAGCSNGGDSTTQSTTTSNTDGTTTQAERTVGGDYISGRASDAKSLYFIGVNDGETADRIGLTMDSLYGITPDQEIFPLWGDVSTEDNRVYEVQLKDNLQWSDPYGQVTAEDFVYLIKNVYQADDNWAGYANPGDWTYTDSNGNTKDIPVEKTGKLTFEVRLNEVDPAFKFKPVLWGLWTLPKDLAKKYVPDKDVEGFKKDSEIQSLSYTGNLGAYTLESWDREAEFTAVRNDSYYMRDAPNAPDRFSEAPYFNSYTYKVIPEESTRLAALKTGEITATGIPSSKAPQYEDSQSINLVTAPQSYLTGLVYNMRSNGWAPFRNTKVRQAFGMAVNKKAIAQNIENGYANPAYTFQPEYSQWFSDDGVTKYGTGDLYGIDKAKQRLQEGLSERSDFHYEDGEVVNNNGEQKTLKFVYVTGNGTTKTMAQYIGQQLNQVGFGTRLVGVKFNTLLNKYVANSYIGEGEPPWSGGPYNAGPREQTASEESWDMNIGIVFNTYPLTPTSTRAFWLKKASTNYYGYYPDAPLKQWYDAASSATDDATRQENLSKIFAALSEEQPENFLVMGTSTSGYQDEVVGPDSGTWNYGYDSQSWYFAQK
ncbi:ABC transporter substrate-binding protein [Salarchaeum sp. JOR-1]|uniref:ABC transporter substrate-binding protein n=1 Tax=Salarchaeum sp. JOR-1 TaxID=2599399 RepID=UPI0011983E8B|nr:ABC transporter substrate-binding protein [Salarchaeum sp. JOR-1]QDX41519.1 ABC transporter substrate-binding protein [Salarchaeum sp. JOR-1]